MLLELNQLAEEWLNYMSHNQERRMDEQDNARLCNAICFVQNTIIIKHMKCRK